MSTLRRYTNLAAAIHLLSTRTITLLNPATWDDRNDAYMMEEYRRHKAAKSVLALCFSQTKETYHHWRVFSHGSDGVCIEFDKDSLLSAFSKEKGVLHKPVRYLQINQIRNQKRVGIDDLPFFKRWPYGDEQEYRIVHANAQAKEDFRSYPIKLAWIQRLTLSPWMPGTLADSVRQTLKSIDGCAKIRMYKSTLIDNENWKKLAGLV